MFRDALAYPARGDEETLLVGAILALAVGVLARLGVLAVLAVAPAVPLAGYALAVLRASAAGADDPPELGDARTLVVDGARALAVVAGYLGGPAVALAVTLGGANAAGRPATVGTTGVVLGAGTVVLLTAAGVAYLLPAALVGVARRRTLRAAVDVGQLGRTAFAARYLVGWVSAVVVAGLAWALASALATVGRVGEALGLAVTVYAVVAVARLLGRSVGE